MICPTCEKEIHPVRVMARSDSSGDGRPLTLGGLVPTCPECNARVPEPAAVESQVQPAPRPRTAQPTSQQVVGNGSQPVLPMLRARLAEIEPRIAELRSLEEEAEMIRRMLAVARPAAPIRAVS